jgi:hypothetical protein
MAAGLGFKDFVTGEVLTAADVDGYLMQGIWVFASAAARDAAVTSPQEGNACYLKDTNQVLTYSGSAWVAVGGGSPLTTKGDIYGFSTVDARIPIGANDTVLTADSTQALGLKWAAPAGSGGMTLISTTTLSSTSTTISVAANSYKNLYAVIRNLGSSNNTNVGVRINSKSGATDYNIRISGSNSGSGFNYSTSNSFSPFNAVGVDGFGSTSDNNGWVEFADCNSTSSYKVINSIMGGSRNGYVMNTTSSVAESAVISGITFVIFDTFTFTGGTVLLYGVA